MEFGGTARSFVQQKEMSKSKNQLIVQNAEEFAPAAKTLMDKTTTNFTGENEIQEFKEKMSFFQKIPAVQEETQIHVAKYDLYVRKHALDSRHDQNILTRTTMFICSW